MAERNHSIRMQRCTEQSTMTPESIKLAIPVCKKTISPHSSYLVSLLASMAKDIQNNEVNADSILEEHLSRIWQDSSNDGMKSESLRFNSAPNHPSNWPKSIKDSVSNFSQSSLFFDNRFNSNQFYRQPPSRSPRGIIPMKKTVGANQLQAAPFSFPMKTPPSDNPEIIRCSWCDSDDELDPSRDADAIFQVIPDHQGFSKKHSISQTTAQHSSLLPSASADQISMSPGIAPYRSSFTPIHNFSQRQSFSNAMASPPIQESPGSKPTMGLENLSLGQLRGSSVLIDHSYSTTVNRSKETIEECSTVIGYYLNEDPIPYRTILPCRNPTLGQFKRHLNKKGHLKFFFKKASDEFDSGVVHEEITDDEAFLPKWQGKVVGKVEVKH